MDYEKQQVRVALSGTPFLVMEEGDGEDVAPLSDLCRMACRLFKENLLNIVWFIALSALALICCVFFFSLFSRLAGNRLFGLIVSLPVLLCGVAPVISLAKYRLALGIWDEGRAAPLEAFKYALHNFNDALFIFWQSILCKTDIILRVILSIAPPLLMGSAVDMVLDEFEIESARLWGFLTAAFFVILMLTFYVWRRARRILTFLSAFNAFEKIDGQSRHWGLRFELMYFWLARKRYSAALNAALLAAVAIALVWGAILAVIISLRLPPLATAYLAALFPFAVRLAGVLWYDIAAAGYYRYNFIPEPV